LPVRPSGRYAARTRSGRRAAGLAARYGSADIQAQAQAAESLARIALALPADGTPLPIFAPNCLNAFRAFILDHVDQVVATLAARQTQTNEVGRCALLLPLLASVPGPLALVEVGASAGLCLLPDRYAYGYGGTIAGDPASPLL
jgi:hypothetical protein